MAYAITVVVHRQGYVPPSSAVEHQRTTVPIDQGASTRRTLIHHDDTAPVPAGGAEEIERYAIEVTADQSARHELHEQARAAMAELQAHIDAPAPSFSNLAEARTQVGVLQDHVQVQAQVLRRLIRLIVGDLTGTA